MKSEIQIRNTADTCLIDIEGTIGLPEEWQFDQPAERVATYERFRDAVRRIEAIDAAQVVVEIRSTGGDVNDALLIHDALRSLGARITTRCYGYTASAATIIAQAASEGAREISPNALYLIHNSVCATEGNAADLSEKVELLRQTDARIAAVYAARSGRPAGEFAALMAENHGTGRWLSPEEAVAAGLADRVISAGEVGENAEPAEQTAEPAHPQNRAPGWQRLLVRLGFGSGKGADGARNTKRPEGAPQSGTEIEDAAFSGTNIGTEAPDESGPDTGPAAEGTDIPGRKPRKPAENGQADAVPPTPDLRNPEPVATAATRRNVLHFADNRDVLRRRPILALHEAQQAVGPTATKPREDPSCHETLRSANERAYAEDVKRLRQG